MNSIQRTTTVPDSLHHKRLDAALSELVPEFSRSQIQQWIKQGFVTVNEKTITQARHKICVDDVLEIHAVLEQQENWQAQSIPLTVIFEDEDILIINKPAGLVVHPGAGNPDQTLVNALLHHCPELATVPRAGLIHRLDKDTSGILAVAKNLAAHHYLVKALQERSIKREYRAIVNGVMVAGGTVDQPIARHGTQRTKMNVSPSGRESVTHYRVLEKFQAHTFLKVLLETGRTHQIRVHLSHIHYPIVGDKTYGKKHDYKNSLPEPLIHALKHFPRQALHAFELTLTHPTTQETLTWQAELPDDMQELLAALRTP